MQDWKHGCLIGFVTYPFEISIALMSTCVEERESGDLLEEVGALLSEVQDMQTHVSSLASSGEGFIMEEDNDGRGNLQKTNRSFEKQLEVEEVMTDEMHQYQVWTRSTSSTSTDCFNMRISEGIFLGTSTMEQTGRLWMSQTHRVP